MRLILTLLTLAFLICADSARAESSPVRLYTILPTGSMEPTFNQDYCLFVSRRPFSTLKIGDIIVYRSARGFPHEGGVYHDTVHRVWARSSGGSIIICKGDNNLTPDRELVTENVYIGVVVAWMRRDEYHKPGGALIVLDKLAQGREDIRL